MDVGFLRREDLRSLLEVYRFRLLVQNQESNQLDTRCKDVRKGDPESRAETDRKGNERRRGVRTTERMEGLESCVRTGSRARSVGKEKHT